MLMQCSVVLTNFGNIFIIQAGKPKTIPKCPHSFEKSGGHKNGKKYNHNVTTL